jgi:hypothetical protein
VTDGWLKYGYALLSRNGSVRGCASIILGNDMLNGTSGDQLRTIFRSNNVLLFTVLKLAQEPRFVE